MIWLDNRCTVKYFLYHNVPDKSLLSVEIKLCFHLLCPLFLVKGKDDYIKIKVSMFYVFNFINYLKSWKNIFFLGTVAYFIEI